MYWSLCVLVMSSRHTIICFFFFNDTATTEIYTLSLHDALPISSSGSTGSKGYPALSKLMARCSEELRSLQRSEEHTSELQSQSNLVCRLLLEKKKKLRQHNARPPPDRPR